MRATQHSTGVGASRAGRRLCPAWKARAGVGCTLGMDLLCHRMGWHLDPGTA